MVAFQQEQGLHSARLITLQRRSALFCTEQELTPEKLLPTIPETLMDLHVLNPLNIAFQDLITV